MAKQYVGARYVPITYENPDDGSANWKANVEYESLTIVVASNGDSYTSKKAVPRSVGAPQDNPEYWVKTGDFNASLLALQGRVNNIENDLNTPTTGLKAKVTALETQNGSETLITQANTLSGGINELANDVNILKNKFYIFMFDSYGGCTDAGVQLDKLLPENMGLVLGVSYSSLTKSGIGFTNVNNVDTFEQVLRDNASRYASIANKITDIVVLGGANDYTTAANVQTAIASFCSYAKATYPNAEIAIGHISGGRGNRTAVDKWQGGNASLLGYQNCSKYGARYLTGVENLLHDSILLQVDQLHPSEAGVAALANQVPNAILGGRAHIHRVVNTNPTFNSSQDIFSAMAITGSIYEQVDDDVCRLYMRQGNDITLTISGSFVDSVPVTKIATIDRKIVIGDGVLAYAIPCMCILKHGNILLANLSGELGLDADGNLILSVANGFTYRGNVADFSDADTLIIKTYGSLTVPSQSC